MGACTFLITASILSFLDRLCCTIMSETIIDGDVNAGSWTPLLCICIAILLWCISNRYTQSTNAIMRSIKRWATMKVRFFCSVMMRFDIFWKSRFDIQHVACYYSNKSMGNSVSRTYSLAQLTHSIYTHSHRDYNGKRNWALGMKVYIEMEQLVMGQTKNTNAKVNNNNTVSITILLLEFLHFLSCIIFCSKTDIVI